MPDTARPAPRSASRPETRLTAQALALVQSLDLTAEERTEALVGLAAANPGLDLRFGLAAPARPGWRPFPLGAPGLSALDLPADAGSLYAHVAAQIGFLVRDARLVAIAELWLASLQPTGWTDASADEIARRADSSPETAEGVLRLLQQAEPAGLFARSLAECLRLQLEAAGDLSPAMAALLDHLELLARGDLAALAHHCGVAPADLGPMIARLRRLDPKPGTRFGAGPVPTAAPDLELGLDETGAWVLDWNSYLRPNLSLRDLGRQADLARAAAQMRALERRDALVFATARATVTAQQEFLSGRSRYPLPLTAAAVAASLGVHETTVGRIRRHLLVGTANGRFRLSQLFFSAIPSGPAAAISPVELMGRIAGQLARTPGLTDQRLADALAEDGIAVARRTIAKYRKLAAPAR